MFELEFLLENQMILAEVKTPSLYKKVKKEIKKTKELVISYFSRINKNPTLSQEDLEDCLN